MIVNKKPFRVNDDFLFKAVNCMRTPACAFSPPAACNVVLLLFVRANEKLDVCIYRVLKDKLI